MISIILKTLFELVFMSLIISIIWYYIMYKYNIVGFRKLINKIKKAIKSPAKVDKIATIKKLLVNYFFIED